MPARIIREATGTVLADKMHFFDRWEPDYPEPARCLIMASHCCVGLDGRT